MSNDHEHEPVFLCPRHDGGLRLTPDACAALWRRGRKAEAWEAVRRCQGCEIGARHAGEPLPPAAPPRGLCCRCGGTGKRLVRHQVCISCYNREREARIGRDRRGHAPRHAVPVLMLSLVVGLSQPVSAPAADRVELALWAARMSPGACIARPVPLVWSPQESILPGLSSAGAARAILPRATRVRPSRVIVVPVARLPDDPSLGLVLSRPAPRLLVAGQEAFGFRVGV